jgi:hypothetical protein
MPNHQLTTPLIIRGLKPPGPAGEVTALEPFRYEEGKLSEYWLRDLLFQNPSLLPISEIEPWFGNASPICAELPVGTGAADLLLLNPKGYITLVETKLLENSESKQSVVGQIIRYAEQMTHWSYSDLVKAVRKREQRPCDDPILERLRSVEDGFDEAAFIKQVSQSLRAGKFLLLIVGDGIRAEVEDIASYLHRFPTLGFTLGLVEIALFGEPGKTDPLFVQPRVLLKTEVIVRAVVDIRAPVEVTIPEGAKATDEGPARKMITVVEYYDKLASSAGGEVVKFVHQVLDESGNHNLTVKWLEGGPALRYVYEPRDTFFNFGVLNKGGKLAEQGFLFWRFKQLALPLEICRAYLDKVACLVDPDHKRVSRQVVYKGSPNEAEILTCGHGAEDYVPLENLVPVKDQWLAAIDEATGKIREAFGE